MILVDTSVWADHFQCANTGLIRLLESAQVACHDAVIGELACGNLKDHRETMCLLRELPKALAAETEEVLHLLETSELFGRGIGWVDAHLLASARLSGIKIWALDKKLSQAATRLNICHEP